MKKFEYQKISSSVELSITSLNDYGIGGWELVSCYESHEKKFDRFNFQAGATDTMVYKYEIKYIYYFKREIE